MGDSDVHASGFAVQVAKPTVERTEGLLWTERGESCWHHSGYFHAESWEATREAFPCSCLHASLAENLLHVQVQCCCSISWTVLGHPVLLWEAHWYIPDRAVHVCKDAVCCQHLGPVLPSVSLPWVELLELWLRCYEHTGKDRALARPLHLPQDRLVWL